MDRTKTLFGPFGPVVIDKAGRATSLRKLFPRPRKTAVALIQNVRPLQQVDQFCFLYPPVPQDTPDQPLTDKPAA